MTVNTPEKQEVKDLIDKSEQVKDGPKKKEWFIVNLRFPKSMIEKVNETVDKRVGITRTGWILETIHEKLRNNDAI